MVNAPIDWATQDAHTVQRQPTVIHRTSSGSAFRIEKPTLTLKTSHLQEQRIFFGRVSPQ